MARFRQDGTRSRGVTSIGMLSIRAGLTILTCAIVMGGAPAQPHQEEPITPVQLPERLDAAKVRLGEQLFRDPRLSGGNVIACSGCHRLEADGADGQALSAGIDGRPLEFNTPTIFNAATSFRLNWRGNFRTLEEENDSVLLNPRIMNTSWKELVAKLRADRDYAKEFAAIYGGGAERASVLDALATFQRSLVTPDARFDKWLRGEPNALSPDEERGYRLFAAYGCIACHQGRNVGGNLFQKFGIFRDPFSRRTESAADLGRFALTGDAADRHVFRVPSLRNVAATAPYFHDGSTASLDQAVRIMARNQLGRELPDADVTLIVRFLDTLTGEYQGRSLAPSDRSPR
jgi:cytochrome c peroxidase